MQHIAACMEYFVASSENARPKMQHGKSEDGYVLSFSD